MHARQRRTGPEGERARAPEEEGPAEERVRTPDEDGYEEESAIRPEDDGLEEERALGLRGSVRAAAAGLAFAQPSLPLLSPAVAGGESDVDRLADEGAVHRLAEAYEGVEVAGGVHARPRMTCPEGEYECTP